MSQIPHCWSCGTHLADLILPLSRREVCANCDADQHVCLMCEYYNAEVAEACIEDRAEWVSDKQRANFCDYFKLHAKAVDNSPLKSRQQASQQLAELFGEAVVDKPPAAGTDNKTEAEQALDDLNKLFGK